MVHVTATAGMFFARLMQAVFGGVAPASGVAAGAVIVVSAVVAIIVGQRGH